MIGIRCLAPLLCCIAAGCAAASASPHVSDKDLCEYLGTIAMTANHLDKPDVSPDKPLRKDCKVCDGKGRYLSGDGLSWIDCKACIPPASVELPPVPPTETSPPKGEVAFAESTLPELAARTHRTAALACDCQTSGICTCGIHCPCAIKGERDGVVMFYTMDACPHCVTCEAKLRAAVKAEKLPFNLRIVKTKDAPSWVKSFPTLHWTTPDGKSHQTHDADELIRFYNPPPKSATATTLYLGASCGTSGCSTGSCSPGAYFGGFSGCSSGSCGSGFGQSYGGWGWGYGGGWSSGFSSGGGCSSCGR